MDFSYILSFVIEVLMLLSFFSILVYYMVYDKKTLEYLPFYLLFLGSLGISLLELLNIYTPEYWFILHSLMAVIFLWVLFKIVRRLKWK